MLQDRIVRSSVGFPILIGPTVLISFFFFPGANALYAMVSIATADSQRLAQHARCINGFELNAW